MATGAREVERAGGVEPAFDGVADEPGNLYVDVGVNVDFGSAPPEHAPTPSTAARNSPMGGDRRIRTAASLAQPPIDDRSLSTGGLSRPLA